MRTSAVFCLLLSVGPFLTGGRPALAEHGGCLSGTVCGGRCRHGACCCKQCQICVHVCKSSREDAAPAEERRPRGAVQREQAQQLVFSPIVASMAMPMVTAMPAMPMIVPQPMVASGVQLPATGAQGACGGCEARVERLETGVKNLSERMDMIEKILKQQTWLLDRIAKPKPDDK